MNYDFLKTYLLVKIINEMRDWGSPTNLEKIYDSRGQTLGSQCQILFVCTSVGRHLDKCCFLLSFKLISVLGFTRELHKLISIMTYSCGYSFPLKMRYSPDSQDFFLRKERKVVMAGKCLCGQGVNRGGRHGRKFVWVLSGSALSITGK